VIKVIVDTSITLSPDEMAAIVDEAHRNGLKVAAHATDDEATRIAAQAGVDSIEHAYSISDDTLRRMAEKKIYLVPTDYPVDFAIHLVPAGERSRVGDQQVRAGLEKGAAAARDRLARAVKLGVPIAAGSDEYFAIPGFTRGESARQIFRAYAAAGLTPPQILRAATIDAAALLGWDKQLGSLEPGLYADLIAAPGDPLEDAGQLDKVGFVMKGGVVVRDEMTSQ
jgi:imidazolonepropionase-like amidohydrolase